MKDKLKGKTALVTGAAKRIGRAICLELASEGVNVVVHYRESKEEAEALLKELESYNVKVWLLQADFEKADEYEKLIDFAFEKTGGLDFLINSASIFPSSTVQNINWDDFIRNIRVNSWVPFYLSRSFAQKAQKGAIINLMDAKMHEFDLKHVAYLISKQILESFTCMTALEFAPNIRVNGIAPGLILPPPGKNESHLDLLSDNLPLKSHGDVRNITDSVIFLLKNDFITGEIIYIDGGGHLRESQNG